MKETAKFVALAVGALLLYVWLEDKPRSEQALVIWPLLAGWYLYHHEKTAEARHRELVNRLERLYGAVNPKANSYEADD